MQVSTIIALLVCCAAFATAAPTKPDLAAALANINGITDKVLAQLQALAASTNNPSLAALLQTAITQIQTHLKPQQSRGIFDSLLSVFNLGGISNILSGLHGSFMDQFYLILEKLLFAGSQVWAQAKPILQDLATNILAHADQAKPIIIDHITQLTAVLANHVGRREITPELQRGFWDSVVSIFGLDKVWSIITGTAVGIKDKFLDTLWTLFTSGTAAWNAAKPIFSQLVSDLLSHASNGGPFLTQAIADLQAIIAANVGKRDLAETRLDILGTLSSVFGLDKIWSTITALHGQVKEQFFLVLEKLLFAGTAAWGEAKKILSQLVTDILAHAENAQPLLQQAVAALTAIVTNATGKRNITPELQRGFFDTLSSVFGLDKVWAVITALHGQVKDQFFLILEKLLFAGTSAWAQAKPIFSQLVADLTAHAENASPLIAGAISSLQSIIAGATGKRGILDFANNLFGFNQITEILGSVSASLKIKLMEVLEKIIFSGKDIINQAKLILSSLVTEMHAHVGNAIPLVSQAIAQLTALVKQ